MKKIILLNYGTNAFYEIAKWDKIYCKSFVSAKRKIKELMLKDWEKKETQKDILKQYDIWVLNNKTLWNTWPVNLANDDAELYIYAEEIILE